MLDLRCLASATLGVVLIGLQAPASVADEGPQWEATSDTGSLGDDVGRFVGASPSLNMVNQGLDTVFVTGNSAKSPALVAAGVNDLDVGTTAYDADTGAVRWKATYDRGIGVNDQIGAFEVNFHNNLIYEMVNSGNDIVTIERAVSDGELDDSAVYAGATVNDSAISSEGGFLGVVGSKGGDFLVLTYQTGLPTFEFDALPVAGRANSADISHTGSLDSIRTLLATGQSSGFGTGGDLYTVAYNYRTKSKLWERSWASPDNRADEGMVAEAAHVSALGKAVGFVAGRTFTPERGWDMVITAYDLATGDAVWPSPVTFDGEASDDDVPLYLAYSDASSTIYLAGTSERGVPHGQDVVTMALDARTGEQKSIVYASGDSSNADDKPTGLVVSKDGLRVFVAADVHNLLGTGGRPAAVFVYDSRLRSAGSRIVGGSGDDRSAGVALNVAQSRAFLAGSTRGGTTGFDHRVTSFGVDDFALPPVEVATNLVFTDASASTGQYTDSATLEARLTAQSGAALSGRSITFALAGTETTVATESDGTARATFVLESEPGTYTATAGFAGEGDYLASEASDSFEITREDASLTFMESSPREGDYSDTTTLTVSLTDDSGEPLSVRDVTIDLAGGSKTVTTEPDGTAAATFPLDSAPGEYTMTAQFAGDTYFLSDVSSEPFQITKEDSAMTLMVSSKGKHRTLTASLFDSDSVASGLSGRQVTFYVDGVAIGNAVTDGTGTASFTTKPKRGTHTFRAAFSGDDYFIGSEAGTTST